MAGTRVLHGPDRVHAARWSVHHMWGRDWYAICTSASDPVITGRVERCKGRDLDSTVTCLACLRILAREPESKRPSPKVRG
jgi:hypothetical protein